MNNFFPILLILIFIFLIYMIADYILIRKWTRETAESIEKIFNSVKVFFMISIIDRITDAISDTSDENEGDEDQESDHS